MSEPFVGEIRMFAGNFAPRGWAFCDGQLLAVSQNDALFSLYGTIYGGDGRTTFGLPDMRGRLPVHAGTGPGLSPRRLGAKGGAEKVTLTVNQLPSHTHPLQASTALAEAVSPQDNVLATGAGIAHYTTSDPFVQMSSQMVTHTGGSRSHTNLMPYLCVNFIVALFGIYPSRH
ncbi:tail fiber protein [Epibacterium sp. MM17-32]|uniref:phage tail protein n=1 Tax=Epibacterium sp. MM17-32 TaxID=2917734 RepID=UPI001EF520DA|nr:tail fiber protein [Epibacterium sp. MM17-32]MCG7629147.1 tail fiber protein [Epibacterium sp. MM17-32]